jgi:iron complex transport system ATP-binding protein
MKQYADERNHAILAILHDINQAMHHFDRLILVKEGKIVGDHAIGMGAISDLSDLYQIQLDVIDRDGSPPLVFPRASLGPNTL